MNKGPVAWHSKFKTNTVSDCLSYCASYAASCQCAWPHSSMWSKCWAPCPHVGDQQGILAPSLILSTVVVLYLHPCWLLYVSNKQSFYQTEASPHWSDKHLSTVPQQSCRGREGKRPEVSKERKAFSWQNSAL